MSERKVLQKYYPPDFDPSVLGRRQNKNKDAGQRIQKVRIMAPWSQQCSKCGTFIYRGRKFNAIKRITGEKYLGIAIIHLSYRCTGCASEIIIRTDPKNNDYCVVSGAVRNNEPWRNRETENEDDEQRLNRLEREEAEAAGEEERNAMEELEAKNLDAQREMAAADALDEIRHRNARINRSEKEGVDFADTIVRTEDEERERQEREDDEAAKKAFAAAVRAQMQMDTIPENEAPAVLEPVAPAPAPSFKRVVKKKKDHSAALGLKKKT